MRTSGKLAALVLTLVVALAVPASSQTVHDRPRGPEYIDFGGARKGALYLPDQATYPAPTTAVLVIHRTSNFLNHPATEELSERGFVVLGMNPHSDNNEAAVDWNRIAEDVRLGVEFLKDDVGMERVVLYGHSGGGPTTSFYQAIAESGLEVCQGEDKITECPEEEAMVGPPADGIVFVDAHPGLNVNRLRSFNGAVTDEANPAELDPDLNPFSEANGFNPDGCSSYSEDFKQRYFEAQSDRMNALTDRALAIKQAMAEGTHFPPDNDAFVVHRASGRLMELDRSIHGATENPQKLLRDDRTIVTDVVETVRVCSPGDAEQDASFDATEVLTVDTFLGVTAIRSTNSMYDIDWCSSNNSTACMVQHIEAPTLVVAAQGHYFMRDGEEIYEMSAADNKDYVVIEGATHSISSCDACDGGPYPNARDNFFDYLAEWINSDFTPVQQLPVELRVAGADRVSTAVALSQVAHPESATAAVVARSDDFADALGAAPLAAAAGGPVLLNGGDALAEGVASELERLGVETAYVMGGEDAVPAGVLDDLTALGVAAERVAGGDRFATAAAAATTAVELWDAQGATRGPGAVVALGTNFPDALAAGVLAAHSGQPLLLTTATEVPPATLDAVGALELDEVTVVGGEAAITPEAVAAMEAAGISVTRVAGADRHATAAEVADAAVAAGAESTTAIVASGRAFPDALAAGPAVAALGGVLLTTEPDALPAVTAEWITAASPMEWLRIAGGTAAVSPDVETQLEELLAGEDGGG